MNNAYRVVWNAVTNTWTAVSEHARGHRKGASRGTLNAAVTLTAVAAGICFATSAHAYVAGNGAQQGNANNTVIGDNADGSAAGCNSAYLPGSACSTIIGNSASSTAGATTVIGDHASTTGANSTAIGAYANAAAWSQAIGAGATASNGWATAIGQSAKALNSNANAIGTNSTASGDASVAIGSSARALADKSFALGYSATANGTGAIAFGNTVTASGSNTIAIGNGAQSNIAGTADGNIAIGSNAKNQNTGPGAIVVGRNATIQGTGGNSSVTGAGTIVMGDGATAYGNNSLVIGTGTSVAHSGGIAIGSGATSAGSGMAVGTNATITSTGSGVVFGNNATASAANTVALGNGSVADRANTISVGTATSAANQIVNVKAGTQGNDVVNVSQLTPVVSALGGGASFNTTTGAVTGPTYNVQGGTQNTVGDALDALDGGLKTAQGDITNLDGRVTTNATNITNLQQQISDGTIGLVQQAAPGADLTVGAGTDGARVNFADKDGNARTLANVADGVADSDAANVGQLNATATQLGDQITTVNNNLTQLGDQVASGRIGLVQQAAAGADLTVGAGTDGARVNFADKDGNARTLANVANGVADSDAANVGQLNTTATQLGDQITTVNNNLSTLDNRVTNIDNSVTQLGDQVASGKIGLVQQAAPGADLTVGAGTDGARVNFADQNGNARTLANVANGVADNDAVNVAQLKATQGQIGDLDQLAVKYGDASQASITLGGTNGTQIHNVANGTADHDAANVGQLNATATQLGDQITTVNNNLSTLDNRVTNIDNSVTQLGDQVASGKIGLVQQAAAGADLTVGASTDGARVNFADQNGNARTLANVANGVADSDAVNVSQLKAAQGQIGDLDQLAVKYGDASQASITLGGTSGTQIHNVADGTADHDAANVGQLNAAATQLGDQITTVNNNLTQLGDQVASGKVGLVQQAAAGADLTVGAGTDGARVNFADQNGNARTLANVANGVADSDAVNVAQLKATQGQIGDLDQLAVKYGDASQASITLGGANGTQIHNVADGTADNDAVNLSQLKNVQAQIGDVGAQLGGAVMYDRFADGSLNLGSVTLGGVGSAAVTLTNVAAGAVNSASTDAVNGSQLYALQTQVDDISGRLGPVTVNPGNGYFDGTDASKDAAVTTPVYAGSGAGNTVGGSGATIADGVDNGTALGSNTSVTADNAVALGAGSVADRANSVSVGSVGNERTITNVAAGTAPTDAANVQQVNGALKSANSYTDSSVGALSNAMNQRFDDTNRAINQVAKNAYAGIAAAMAMPNMTPSGPGKTVVAAGGATYKGGSAVAAGATYRSRDGKWLMNGALSVTSTGDAGARAQVGYEF
ncbi:ESPR-type extended signal peptide-containing protein [Burkholderia sp. GS2Y]|uniref:ESPR-type extended signal peptide-containing protein n=1 Tax=Burkholderia theae TaxID=3143496 RepID=A0ABU9WAV7_9BURK